MDYINLKHNNQLVEIIFRLLTINWQHYLGIFNLLSFFLNFLRLLMMPKPCQRHSKCFALVIFLVLPLLGVKG